MSSEQQWDYSFDVVVVGSGNGGMTAALCAYEMGTRDVLLIEKSHLYGGTSSISGGGVCVSMPEDPGMGNLLALTMHLPNMDSAVISLGKVAWSRPGDGGEWDVGVEFWWVGWEDKDAQESIRDYISSTLKSKPSG